MDFLKGIVSYKKAVLFFLVFFLSGCAATLHPLSDLTRGILTLPSGEQIKVFIADTPEEGQQGLSGIQPEQLGEDEGMLFVSDQEIPQQFWMVDTYFDLDIFFLDSDFEVVAIERNMPAHPGRGEPPKIARTESVMAKYVLEMKADSEMAKQIDLGQMLQFQ